MSRYLSKTQPFTAASDGRQLEVYGQKAALYLGSPAPEGAGRRAATAVT